jgi:hypothetical protein
MNEGRGWQRELCDLTTCGPHASVGELFVPIDCWVGMSRYWIFDRLGAFGVKK